MSLLQCTIGMDRVSGSIDSVNLTKLMESYLDNIQKLAAAARIPLSAAPTPGYSDSVTFDGHVRTGNGVREAAFAGLRSD
jgi:hypothetical protein